MKKLLILTLATFTLQGLACSPRSVSGKPITPKEGRVYCASTSPLNLGGATITVSVDQLRTELNNLMNQHNGRIQGMNQLLMHDLPQRQSIEQLLFQRHQHISRMVYIQNVLAGPLYPNQRQQALFEYEQLRMGLSNGDTVLNQFIRNYHFMYDQFWKLNTEAVDLRTQIQGKQQALGQAIEKQKQDQPTPQKLAALEAEKKKLDQGKVRLLALAKEAETAAQRALELQNESGSLVDELSETLNWDN